MPKSIWLVRWNDGSVSPTAALVSFAITWLLVMVQVRTLAHRHAEEAV